MSDRPKQVDQFSEDETAKLDKILAIEVNPFLRNDVGSFKLPLGGSSTQWLFSTHMNLPESARAELEHVLNDEVPADERIMELNDYLETHQVSSAPLWWELDFFEFNRGELWDFVVEQCRRNYGPGSMRDLFDYHLQCLGDLNKALLVLRVSKYNKEKFSNEEQDIALKVYDQSYPLDFKDHNEVPKKSRSPLEKIRELIAPELSDPEAVFSKRWFEFKILDELADYELFLHESARDSELSRKIAAQVRGFVQRQLISLGRMVEHYRWKFRFEHAARRGIQTAQSDKVRGRKGGEASERLKMENVKAYWAEIEALSDLYPRMSEQAIFAQAYANAAARRKMPKSQKTIESYGVTIRSEPPFKSWFDAIFRKKA